MNRKDILVEFFVNKNYEKLKNILSESQLNSEKDILARVYLEEKNYKKASELFCECGMHYEHGRCELLLGNFEAAKEIWHNIKEDTPAVLWGRSLLEFINLYVIHIPTFFSNQSFFGSRL